MTSSSSSIPGHPIALIGFGEAGQAIVKGWRTEAPELAVRAFDIKTRDAATARAKWNDYESAQVTGCETLEDALDGAGTVFSLVTADQAHLAAREAADLMQSGTLFFDGNSCAPGTKRASAQAIESAGGRYVDMAVMAPVHPKLHKVPLLVCGPHAKGALPVLAALGMQARLVPGDVGRASSIKILSASSANIKLNPR